MVSVIIPTYNRAQLLPRALDSVIAQTFEDWEIVLVDDGSTDDTAAALAPYQAQLGDKLRLITQPHMGCCAARNRGIDKSRGRYLAFLDSDDEFLPTKLARQLELFRKRPELGLVYSDSAYVDLSGRRHDSVFADCAPHARRVACREIAPKLMVCPDLFDMLIREYFISTIVGMVHRQALSDSIRFQEDPAYAEEWLFYLKIAHTCEAGFVDEPLSLHHQTRGSLARTDSFANSLGRRTMLKLILKSFRDLTFGQRRMVGRNLAAVCDQLGYDCERRGDHAQATRFWLESVRWRPRVDASARAIRSLLRKAFSKTPLPLRGKGQGEGASSKAQSKVRPRTSGAQVDSPIRKAAIS